MEQKGRANNEITNIFLRTENTLKMSQNCRKSMTNFFVNTQYNYFFITYLIFLLFLRFSKAKKEKKLNMSKKNKLKHFF